MNIVVLDGYTLNPGDLSWSPLEAYGALTVYDRTPTEKIIERSAGAEILMTNKTFLDGEILRSLPGLKYIGVLATGFDVVDIDEAGKLGIIVTNIPSYSTNSVAQLTFALILELCHHVQKFSDSVTALKWTASEDFTFRDYPLMELESKIIGIIGFGNIGRKVCEIAAAFGMKALAFDKYKGDQPKCPGFAWASLPEIFTRADIVTLHTPLTPETEGLVNSTNLNMMKSTSFLINTSRGQVVRDQDLAYALNNGIIAGAGLDVLSTEPPAADNPLLTAKNCIITPHIAWSTKEARTRLMDIAVRNVEAFLSGKPVNVVS